MNNLIYKLLRKQTKGHRIWGAFRQAYTSVTFYISALNLMMISATFYETVLKRWSASHGFDIQFWQFILIIIFSVQMIMIFEYKITIPSSSGFISDQQFTHGTLLPNNIRKILANQDEIKQRLSNLEQNTKSHNETQS